MSFAPEVFLCFGFGEILAPRCVLIYGRCGGELVFAAGPAWRVLSACSTDFFMGVKRPKVVQCQTRMMVGKGSWFSVYAFRRLCRKTDFWPNRRNLSGETHCEKMGQPFLAMKASVRRRMTLVRARHNVTAEASAQGVDVRPRRCDVESSESDGRFQRAESGQPHGERLGWHGQLCCPCGEAVGGVRPSNLTIQQNCELCYLAH